GLAGVSLAGAVTLALLLPREKGFVRSQALRASARQMLRHLKDPQLLATYGIGFGVLFNFIAVFTYVSFHLAAAPYHFSSTLLGAIFSTYLILADDRLDDGQARTPAFHPRSHCRMDGRRGAHARAADSGAPPAADVLRGVRHAVPDDRDRLRHRNREGRALVRRRPLRDLVLYRRQHGCLPARTCLGAGRMAGDDRDGGGRARRHGGDCRARLSGRDGLGSTRGDPKGNQMTVPSRSQFEFLQSIDTPTVCNLVEIVAPERRGFGYTVKHLHCPFPELAPIVGFAK